MRRLDQKTRSEDWMRRVDYNIRFDTYIQNIYQKIKSTLEDDIRRVDWTIKLEDQMRRLEQTVRLEGGCHPKA